MRECLGQLSGLMSNSVERNLKECEKTVLPFALYLHHIDSKTPPFVKHLLLKRWDKLFCRQVIADVSVISSGLCVGQLKTELHLLLLCEFAKKLWYLIFKWLYMVNDLPSLFSVFYFGVSLREGRRGILMIWHAALWVVRKSRNGVVFSYKNILRFGWICQLKMSSRHVVSKSIWGNVPFNVLRIPFQFSITRFDFHTQLSNEG